jgi:hypothetical protein
MSLHLSNRARSQPCTFRPQLEALESRDCPSAVVTFIPHTLLILGDSGDNTVKITDNGSGTVTASVDSVPAVTKSGINNILVLTRGGNDTVNYNLTGTLTTPRLLSVDLGSLADTAANKNSATLDFGGNAINSYFAAVVVGTAGQDTVSTANFTGDIKGVAALAVYSGGGADSTDVAYQGTLTGTLAFYLDGQGGNDTVSATVKLNDGSTGNLAAVVEGGNGDDNLTLTVEESTPNSLAHLIAVLNGGAGTDTCTTTSNVLVFNCEM